MFFCLNYTLLYFQKIFASEPTVYHLNVYSTRIFLTNIISGINYVDNNGSIKMQSISTFNEDLKENSDVYKHYFDLCDIICKCFFEPSFILKHVKTSNSNEMNIFIIDDLPVLIRDTSKNEYYFIGFEFFEDWICIKLSKCINSNKFSFYLDDEVLYFELYNHGNIKTRKYSEIKNLNWYKKMNNPSSDLINEICHTMTCLLKESQSITE